MTEQKFDLDQRLLKKRAEMLGMRDPTADDDVLRLILAVVRLKRPSRYLEVGAAEGLTTAAVLLSSDATATAIELDPERAARARENFALFRLERRAVLLEGDAGEILPMLGGSYDVIFLDGPKAQYKKYLPDLKRLLSSGGALISDDVLLNGWVLGEAPKKRRMLIEHIREYLDELNLDGELITSLLPIGQGVALSVKK